MIVLSFNPRAEKDALATALSVFRARWAQTHSAEGIVEFCDAIARAAAVCEALEQYAHASQSELLLVKLLLQIRLAAARAELARVQEQSVLSPLLSLPTGTLPQCPSCEEERGLHSPEASQARAGSAASELAAGTILSCPQCAAGLYIVAAAARVDELVLDDGTLLQPLTPTIPQREAWRALACPCCGSRYYKDGKLHTLQGGWQ